MRIAGHADSACCCIIFSDYMESTLDYHKKWYCPYGARYRISFGLVLQVEIVESGISYYLRSGHPFAYVEDIIHVLSDNAARRRHLFDVPHSLPPSG